MAIMMLNICLLVALTTSSALASANYKDHEENPVVVMTSTSSSSSSHIGDDLSSLRGVRHLLNQYNPRALMTCDEFPRVCRAEGSPGPDCCRKQCVNVMTDNLNCGQCGKKCRYGEACCGGNCVNVMYDHKNCGSCKNRCKKGSFCQYGMCSYA